MAVDKKAIADAVLGREVGDVEAYIEALGVEKKKAQALILLGARLAEGQAGVMTSLGIAKAVEQK
jgi:hypothetical protein